MKININKLAKIQIPTDLALNGVTAALLARKLRDHGYDISSVQLKEFFQAFRQYRKAHPEWVPVEVLSGGEDAVQIRL